MCGLFAWVFNNNYVNIAYNYMYLCSALRLDWQRNRPHSVLLRTVSFDFTLFSLQKLSDYCIKVDINMNYVDTLYETSIQSPLKL